MSRSLIALSISLILSACASQPPAPQEDVRTGNVARPVPSLEPHRSETSADSRSAARVDEASQRPAQPPQQPVPIRERQGAKALPAAAQSLLSSAQRAFSAGDYEGAIANAERGLRIARTSSELLMVLAKSYAAQSDFEQARVFAQRGLRYLPAGAKRREFEDLLRRLPN
ncbi:tetratricopeptide repeat protein [Pseudoteredinibacter isoporae]|uniref:tetratricopeptide repeat protein n=1 Tax=Pseudoteredinibacter isoporae TaxID=570281 RepID=UPI00310788FB